MYKYKISFLYKDIEDLCWKQGFKFYNSSKSYKKVYKKWVKDFDVFDVRFVSITKI